MSLARACSRAAGCFFQEAREKIRAKRGGKKNTGDAGSRQRVGVIVYIGLFVRVPLRSCN